VLIDHKECRRDLLIAKRIEQRRVQSGFGPSSNVRKIVGGAPGCGLTRQSDLPGRNASSRKKRRGVRQHRRAAD
jgi:hypothetical protein